MANSHMPTLLLRDSNNETVQLMPYGAPQTVSFNGSAGAATLSAALSRDVVRLNPTVDCFVMSTVAGSVTAATGHFIAAYSSTDFPLVAGDTKISMLAVGTAGGTMYLSELG